MSKESSIPEQYRLVETRLQEKLDNGTTRCHLCLWRCKIGHGQRGFCQAHVNRDGTLYNLSYGILSAIDVSRIEDKPERHFKHGSKVMSVGRYGCNFRCGGCHNLEISWGVDALDDLARYCLLGIRAKNFVLMILVEEAEATLRDRASRIGQANVPIDLAEIPQL